MIRALAQATVLGISLALLWPVIGVGLVLLVATLISLGARS